MAGTFRSFYFRTLWISSVRVAQFVPHASGVLPYRMTKAAAPRVAWIDSLDWAGQIIG